MYHRSAQTPLMAASRGPGEQANFVSSLYEVYWQNRPRQAQSVTALVTSQLSACASQSHRNAA